MPPQKAIIRFRTASVRSQSLQGDFRIGAWLIQPQLHTISRDAQITHVEPKAMQVLVYLAEHADEVVAKERLIRAVWADTFVTDDVLTRCISELRKAFDDDAKEPKVIATIPRSGYRLLATVERGEARDTEVPERSRRWPMVLALGLGVVILGLALDVGGLRGRIFRSSPPQIRSLAVLPLANLSGDQEQEYFADGVTDELITDLARIGALRVISRTSAMNYKGAHKPLPEIARELNVDAVVVGTVQRSGGRVRISAQLVEARTDRHLWADSYERDLREVLALEGEVARAIAGEIRLKLTPQEQGRLANDRPLSPEAHEAYLKGLYFWNQLAEKDVRKSITYFERAIQLAPEYVPAYASLAFSYNLLASSEYAAPQDAYPQAKKLARQAIALDEDLAGGHAALGFALCYSDWDWPAAEAEFKRANELEPSGEGAHAVYALYLGDMGRSEEAIAEMKRSLELDPLSVLGRLNLGWLYWTSGKSGQAIEQFQKTLEVAPNSPDAHQGLGIVYSLQGRHAEAIAELQEGVRLSEDNAWPVAWLGYAYAAAGRRNEAHQVLNDLMRMSKRKYLSAYLVATVYAGLGEKEQAFRWLAKALEERSDLLVSLKVDPLFASLRSDPRFAAVLRQIGLPE